MHQPFEKPTLVHVPSLIEVNSSDDEDDQHREKSHVKKQNEPNSDSHESK